MNLPDIPLFVYETFPASRNHAEIWEYCDNSEELQEF